MADELRHTDCDCCEHAQKVVDGLRARIKEPLTDEGWMFACLEARQDNASLRTQLALKDKALAWQVGEPPRVDGKEVLGYWDKSCVYAIIWWSDSDEAWFDDADNAQISVPTHWRELTVPIAQSLSPSMTDAKTDADPS